MDQGIKLSEFVFGIVIFIRTLSGGLPSDYLLIAVCVCVAENGLLWQSKRESGTPCRIGLPSG